jgi:urate oxidase
MLLWRFKCHIHINSYSIKWNQYLSTSLYAALDGVASATSISEGERIAYIHRDDLKDLLLESLQNLRQNDWIQNEATFVEHIQNIFIRMFPLVDSISAEFTKEMWTHTYTAHDLAPDRVSQFVYQKYDESSSQSSSSTSGGLSSIGFSFSASDAKENKASNREL